jgi:CubicO group peptidase (beta-lactamase class C family)
MKNVDGEYQLNKSYPVGVTDENFDNGLITNQMNTFYGYSGQGCILVKSENLLNFKVYVNGHNVSFNNSSNSEWNRIDISKATIDGDNKLQVSKVKEGINETLEIKIPYPVLVDATDKYKENDNLKFIDQIIQAEIDRGFTSAQLVITKNGKIIKQKAYGEVNSYHQDGTRIENGKRVTDDTLYDLASNTKMYTTNYAIQKLVSEGRINIEQKVQEIYPDFKDKEDDKIKGKDMLTIKEILQHQAGFPADPQYHNNNYDPDAKDLSTLNANKLYTQNRDEMMKMVIDTPLEYEPGTKTIYSDVDYILLGFIVEKVSGQRLDEYLKENYYKPLGLNHVTFNPLEHGFNKDDVAATELNGNTRDGVVDFNNIRKTTVQGQVHDEKAFYSMGGISGHAGLFSNAGDLAVLTQITLNRGGYGNHKFFNEETLDEFVKPKDNNPSYGLGWRRKGTTGYSWAFSPIADTSTIGHTGWVGSLTVIDPVNNISVILLTNKKNSPVLDKEGNANDFIGDHFLTGKYGLISTLSFDSIENSSKEANDSKLVDMIASKYELIQENEKYKTEPDKASLKALTDVMEKRKKDSAIIKEFMKSDKWKTISSFLSDQ